MTTRKKRTKKACDLRKFPDYEYSLEACSRVKKKNTFGNGSPSPAHPAPHRPPSGALGAGQCEREQVLYAENRRLVLAAPLLPACSREERDAARGQKASVSGQEGNFVGIYVSYYD